MSQATDTDRNNARDSARGFAQLSQRQVAALLGVSRTAVYLTEQRALKKLLKALSNDPQIRDAFPRFFKPPRKEN